MTMLRFSADVRNAFNDDMETYLNFSRLMVDTANHCVTQFSEEQANNAIRSKMNAILGLNENSSRKDIRRAIRKHKIDVYEVIEDTVENLLVSGWSQNPFFREYVEVKNYNDGDTNEFYVDDESILTISKLSGNHHDIIRQRLGFGSTFSVKTEWYGCKIYAEFELFMAGRVDWAKFITKIYEAYDRHINNMLYTAVMSAADKLPNNTQWVKNLQMIADNRDTIIQLAEDVETATGKEVVIMGTKTALAKLNKMTEINWISESMRNERHTTGRIGLFEGIRLVEIPQAFAPNDTTTKLVDNTKLMFMPVGDNKFVKLYNEGESQIREITDGDTNMDKTIEYELQYKIGLAVILGLRFGLVKITG